MAPKGFNKRIKGEVNLIRKMRDHNASSRHNDEPSIERAVAKLFLQFERKKSILRIKNHPDPEENKIGGGFIKCPLCGNKIYWGKYVFSPLSIMYGEGGYEFHLSCFKDNFSIFTEKSFGAVHAEQQIRKVIKKINQDPKLQKIVFAEKV